jgi:two-component system alkaline phosphatase synthesis response regulator PhoP
MSARILIVDDDDAWRVSLGDTLKLEGFEVAMVATGEQATSQIQAAPFDLCILDVQLPDREGYDLCLEIRKQRDYVPIIMISGVKRELMDREVGLRLGADRYFEKPTEPREIVAQVRALLRMKKALRVSEEVGGWLDIDSDLRINFSRRLVSRNGELVDVSPQEFKLLAYLVRNAGLPCTRNDLMDNVWGAFSTEEVSDAAINTMVARLRQKIEPDPRNPRYILTVHRWGYKFREL